MDRDNFYLLLELSLEPPETNDEVIWKAIQQKKAEWSRMRNHPTKGIQAQKYISLIPEIQRVMMYNDFRQKEAVNAIQILKEGKADKYVEIDRHIDTFLGKGFIEAEEVTKLAQIHNIDENDIRYRIQLKLEGKMDQVDQEISIRMAKGYLTEADLSKIADRHSLKPDQVRERVRCPIAKDDKEKIEPPRPLEKSIEKGIIDNLKIIKKISLYDFLDAPVSLDLKMLQEKSSLKKRELSNLSKKDADVTASSVLAGYCLTIFKNAETRYAYDVSLANARLASLYSDIDMAAIEGNIRLEYFDILTKKAMEYGMDSDEASRFIKVYCEGKNYQIEQKEQQKEQSVKIIAQKKSIIVRAAIGTAALVMIALAVVFFFMLKKGSALSEYQAVLENVEKQTSAEEKTKLLKQYLAAHPQKNKFTQEVASRIEQIEIQAAEKEFDKVVKRAEKLIQDGNAEQALSIYQEYVGSNPPAEKKSQTNEKIRLLSEQIEQKNFDDANTVVLNGEPDQKIAALKGYLAKYPDGAHKIQVENLIKEMSGEYFIFIKKKLTECEQSQNWQDCLNLCQSYIDLYDNSNSDQIKQMLPIYQTKVRNEAIFKSLVEKANQKGKDYNAAQQIYKDYLAAYPDSPIKGFIQAEIAKLVELAAIDAVESEKTKIRNLLLNSGGRFAEKKDGVVIDSKTGLMWSLVDAGIAKPKACINYEEAKKYVDELTTAEYTDWRLPTPAELAGIYKASPSFPSLAANELFWTSESYTSYSDGWHIKVSVFGKDKGGQWESLQMDAKECANVRAVRKQ